MLRRTEGMRSLFSGVGVASTSKVLEPPYLSSHSEESALNSLNAGSSSNPFTVSLLNSLLWGGGCVRISSNRN